MMHDNDVLVATISTYRRKGGFVVTIERNGTRRRHVVSLRRHRSLRDWLVTRYRGCVSGEYLQRGISVDLWAPLVDKIARTAPDEQCLARPVPASAHLT